MDRRKVPTFPEVVVDFGHALSSRLAALALHSLIQRHLACHMTAFYHTIGEPRSVLLHPQKPFALFQSVIKLPEIALGQLGERDVSQLRDDMLIDAVFVVRLGFGPNGRFAVRLVSVIQPGPEGHIYPGPLRFRTLEA